jgi:tRNA1(Val) A37 N6-methylase TrmN6
MPASAMSFAPMPADAETTEDAVLGGRLVLRQRKRGHRVGHDAILLAAATPARPGESAVDLGAGVGAAGLALACRVPDLAVTLVELDATLAELARENAARNGLAGRVQVAALDVHATAQQFARAVVYPESFEHVLMNPPFNDSAPVSPDPARRIAHVTRHDTLSRWIGRASLLLAPSGTLTLIWRADGLADVFSALAGFGAVTVLPVHPKPSAPAIRILLRAVKESGAPLSIRPGLTLNDADGTPSAEAEAILRGGMPLAL